MIKALTTDVEDFFQQCDPVGDLFAHVRKKQPWADPKVDKVYALLGEKTAADNEKPVKKKKEKPVKVEDKKPTSETAQQLPSEEELNPYLIFPAPEENYKVYHAGSKVKPSILPSITKSCHWR